VGGKGCLPDGGLICSHTFFLTWYSKPVGPVNTLLHLLHCKIFGSGLTKTHKNQLEVGFYFKLGCNKVLIYNVARSIVFVVFLAFSCFYFVIQSTVFSSNFDTAFLPDCTKFRSFFMLLNRKFNKNSENVLKTVIFSLQVGFTGNFVLSNCVSVSSNFDTAFLPYCTKFRSFFYVIE